MKLSHQKTKQALANVGAINQDLIDEHTDFLVQGSRSGNLGLDLLLEEKNRQVVRGLSLPALIIRVIRRSTQRKVFALLRKLLESDREVYEKF